MNDKEKDKFNSDEVNLNQLFKIILDSDVSNENDMLEEKNSLEMDNSNEIFDKEISLPREINESLTINNSIQDVGELQNRDNVELGPIEREVEDRESVILLNPENVLNNNNNIIFRGNFEKKENIVNNGDIDNNYGIINQNFNQENIKINIDNNNIDNNNIDNNNIDNNNIDNNINGSNKKELKRGLVDILTNKKFLMVVAILIFIFTSITVGKTFYLRSVVDNYEEFFIEIEEKESLETIIYDDSEIGYDNLNSGAATELINCINASIDVNSIPDSIKEIIDEINDYYNQSNNYFAFKYKDIYTGFSVSYNENQKIFTASTIKAPKDIYIYEMASLGKIDLDEELVYTTSYYNTGSGVLKNKRFNTKYSVRTLSKYSIVESDNAAHNMLMDKFGRSNMLAFWQEKGTEVIFTYNSNWGFTNAHDASIYMEELYKFYLNNDTYGQELMNNFLKTTTKFIKGNGEYKIANKIGWSGSTIHDVAIVFADNPYIIVALSNLGDTDYYMSYFNKANDFASRLHTEYWKYKMDVCSNIGQY